MLIVFDNTCFIDVVAAREDLEELAIEVVGIQYDEYQSGQPDYSIRLIEPNTNGKLIACQEESEGMCMRFCPEDCPFRAESNKF